MLEHLSNKKKLVFRYLLIIGITIISVGGLVAIHGYFVYESASLDLAFKLIPVNQSKTPEYIEGSLISDVAVQYQTNDGILSANNPFNYTITAVVNNPDQIDKIVAFPWTVVDGMTYVTTDYVMSSIKNGTISSYDSTTLNRIPNSNEFTGSQINYDISTERNLGFFLIPYTNGIPRGGIFVYQQDPLVIHPEIDELQAQTDRDIQKQNIESAESNALVLGLTLVIIGLIPIGFAMEVIVHGWLLREDKKDQGQ